MGMKYLFMLSVLLSVGCAETIPPVIENVVIIEYTEPEPTPEPVTEPVPEVPVKSEPIEVIEVELRKLDVFEKYAVIRTEAETKVYGIEEEVLTCVFLYDVEDNVLKFESFTKSGDDLFFSAEYMEQGAEIEGSDPVQYEAVAVTKYYQQENGEIYSLSEDNFPDIP